MKQRLHKEWNTKNAKHYALWEKLQHHSRCVIVKLQHHAQILQTPIQADIGIIPYDTQEAFSKHCHPIKFYYYMALGIPIVSTPIQCIKQYASRYIYFTESTEKFCARVRSLAEVKIPKSVREKMFAVARKQTYESKANVVADVITLLRKKL